MSMVINLVEDHNIYLCEGGPVYNGGVSPTPITYLTQWKIVGNSEVHTLPYPDGVVLPNGYKRCKYLEFHGTEYINSGVLAKNDVGFSLDLSTTVSNKTIIGARPQDTRGIVVGYNYMENGIYKMYISYGMKSRVYTVPINISDGLVHHIVLDSQQVKLDSENVEIDRGNAFPQLPIFIGTWNNNGVTDYRMFIGKIYSVILYDSNGNLFNGIPCLDDNNVPCLYDTVSGTSFYNDGTDTFGYELYPQPTEIWSCGEYNPIDGKYHILVQPLGGSITDIALTKPLRKVNNVADTIEFPSGTDGKALVTRNLKSINLYDYVNSILRIDTIKSSTDGLYAYLIGLFRDVLPSLDNNAIINGLCSAYIVGTRNDTYNCRKRCISISPSKNCHVYDSDFDGADDIDAFKAYITEVKPEFIYELATPTTELVDAPQIEEADSYTCVISQGGKAVEWSSFSTS